MRHYHLTIHHPDAMGILQFHQTHIIISSNKKVGADSRHVSCYYLFASQEHFLHFII